MLKLLSIRTAPLPRETLPSFLSRLAAMNGVSATDFALDLGSSLKRFLELDSRALDALATVSGLDAAAVKELLSWTGRPVGDVRTEFRGEVFVSRALRSPRMRGCPICIREDAVGHDKNPTAAMVMRGDWQLREASLCVRHGHPLVTLWEENLPRMRFEVGERLRAIVGPLMEGHLDMARVRPSAYDHWLDARIEAARDASWLAGQSLFAATTICRILGTELLRADGRCGDASKAERRAAQAVGFEAARQGPAGIDAALDRLVARADGPMDGPNTAFGQLLSLLSKDYAAEPAFGDFRDLLREKILSVWPVDPGDELLGETIAERKLHSIGTAAREAGTSRGLIEQFLVEAGAIDIGDPRPAARKTFPAAPYADLLRTVPELIGSPTMRSAVGASEAAFTALTEDGILRPRTVLDVKARWHPDDGHALLEELDALASVVDGEDPAWEQIQRAKVRSGLRVGAIIGGVRRGSLQLARSCSGKGYDSFLVRRDEIDRIAPPNQDLTAAAQFGRSVGLRDGGRFLALVAAGHTPARRKKHPGMNVERFYVSSYDRAAFHRRFVTLTTLAAERNTHRNTIAARLKAARVHPFAPNGADFGQVWLREEAEAVFA